MSEDSHPVLSFRNVTWTTGSDIVMDLAGVSFDLNKGDIALVRQDVRSHDAPVFDLAEGLKQPDDGSVEFMGRDWRRVSEFESARRRGLIGRVFEGVGFVSNLDVYENIVLAEQHHTSREEDDIRAEVEGLMRVAGFDAIPQCRPHQLRRDDLRRAQWVRAFLGRPALVLLERPAQDVHRDDQPGLLGLVKQCAGRGGAVVWLSPNTTLWQDEPLKTGKRYRLEDGRLLEGAGE